MPAAGFQQLTDDQARKLKSVEGNGVGNGVLPALVDQALVGAATATSAAAAAAAAQSTATLAAPRAKFVAYDVAVPGGSATPAAIAVTGLLASDLVLGLTAKTANANKLLPVSYAVADGFLTVVYSADPGASGVLHLAVLKA